MLKIKERRARCGRDRRIAASYQGNGMGAVNMSARLLSGKHLDLLVLAFCSCLLTLLCHPSPSLFPASGSTNGAMSSAAPSTSLPIDFYIKSVLMSSYQDQRQQAGQQDA